MHANEQGDDISHISISILAELNAAGAVVAGVITVQHLGCCAQGDAEQGRMPQGQGMGTVQRLCTQPLISIALQHSAHMESTPCQHLGG
jgi:hypothetical protein